jgi:hypothetical protein
MPSAKLSQSEVNKRDIEAGFEILSPTEPYLGRYKKRKYKCPRCGTLFETQPIHIWSKNTKSCGCLHSKEPTPIKLKALYLTNRKEYYRQYRLLRGNEKSKQWEINNKERRKIINQKYKPTANLKRQNRNKQLKIEVLTHYSNNDIPECQLCKNTNIVCLSIDHIQGDGAKHRYFIGRHIYAWLKQNNYPTGYQCLCMNCQHIKAKKNGEFNNQLPVDVVKSVYFKTYHQKRRLVVLNHYCGGDIKCQKCGQTNIDCLTIDHINNDGAKHRKSVNNIIGWLIKNNFPDGFQILCMNCQFEKQFGKNLGEIKL